MLLAVDIGNTNVTLALVADGELVSTRRAATPRSATADELEVLLGGLIGLDGRTLADVSALAVASVVPALTGTLDAVAARHGIPILVASAGNVPLAVRVDRPLEVGADRLVNALAAARLYGTPAVVVDFGTATTLDCVGIDGAYVGGAIAPGLELGLEALAATDREAAADRAAHAGPGDRARHGQRHAGGDGVRVPGAGVGAAGPGSRRARGGLGRASRPTSARSSPAGSRRRPGRGASRASTSSTPT